MNERDEMVAEVIHHALFPNTPWAEQLTEVKDEMRHAANRAIHVLTLQRVVPSNRELLRAMWEDYSKDPHNLAVLLPQKIFAELYDGYCKSTQQSHPDFDYTLINIPPMTAEEIQMAEEEQPKGIVRRWLESLSR